MKPILRGTTYHLRNRVPQRFADNHTDKRATALAEWRGLLAA